MVKIKICGLFREEDIAYVNEARPDYAGFVFARSRRQVAAAQAAKLRGRLAEGIVPVGVFVDAPLEDIGALYREGVIAVAQLHGGEDREYVRRLKEGWGMPVIKAVAVKSREDIAQWETVKSRDDIARWEAAGSAAGQTAGAEAAGSAAGQAAGAGHSPGGLRAGPDFLLLDNGAGGTGERFDWKQVLGGDAADGEGGLPYFIAGGIDDSNIREALGLELFGVKPFGIDVSSGAETDGLKDRDKIARLVKIVRQYGGEG
jgi:phosphoribosylanthranilate isomerase